MVCSPTNFGRSARMRDANGSDAKAASAASRDSNQTSANPSQPAASGSRAMLTTYASAPGMSLAISACGPSQYATNSSCERSSRRRTMLTRLIVKAPLAARRRMREGTAPPRGIVDELGCKRADLVVALVSAAGDVRRKGAIPHREERVAVGGRLLFEN